ncbi:MAG: lipopolysaccharide biosynthesis protein [Bacteroidota bacterium]
MLRLSQRLRATTRLWQASRLVRPALTLVGGTAAAQAVVFAARPLLTRLYSPEAFGILTVFTTVIAVGSTFISGGYRFALLLPRHDDRAGGLLTLALGCALGWALLAGLTGLGLSLTGSPLWDTAFWLLPPALWLADSALSFDVWHTRYERFKLVSSIRIVQSLTVIGVQLGAGVLLAGSVQPTWGLVSGATAGFTVAATALGVWVFRNDRDAFAPLNLRFLRRLGWRYQRFPRYSAPAALLNVAATRAPVFLLAAFFGSGVVGQFGIAYGTLALPIGLITGSVSQVFFVRAAEATPSGSLAALTRDVLRGLWVVSLLPALAVLVAGPALFSFVFGAVWAEAGLYAQYTAPWVLLAAVAAALTPVFDVLERQRADFSFSVAMFVVQVSALIAASLLFEARTVVLIAGLVGATLRLGHLIWILRLARVPLRAPVLDGIRSLLLTVPFAAVIALAAWGEYGDAWVFAATIASGLAYGLLVVRKELRTYAASASTQ